MRRHPHIALLKKKLEQNQRRQQQRILAQKRIQEISAVISNTIETGVVNEEQFKYLLLECQSLQNEVIHDPQ